MKSTHNAQANAQPDSAPEQTPPAKANGHQKYKLEIISYNLCPFVQRAVVALNMKKAQYAVTYIDLANRPAWFYSISPLGKVPVLKIDETTSIFESAVICEFLDDVIGPRFHSTDPLIRAKERAWVEFGSSLIVDQGNMWRETNLEEAVKLRQKFYDGLARLETIVSHSGPYFRGAQFSLVDANYAPVFYRLSLFPKMFDEAFTRLPHTKAWARSVVQLPEVQTSVIPNYQNIYFERMRKNSSALFNQYAP